jgi:serine/threonine protein kinase
MLTPGYKIGPYRIIKEIGRGGMGRVYRSLHEDLQREVALKELLPEPKGELDLKSRFRREALALAAFHHQNIVTLYDLVDNDGSLFMAMELVEGPSLTELLEAGPLPAHVVAAIGSSIASALAHAHHHNVIHRDLKPSNVMISTAGEVKLMDFGIAKNFKLAALTRKGEAVGTPAYMSPEQASGDPIDARTDIFSLGILLYEALTGKKPFQGATLRELFEEIGRGNYTPLSEAAPDVPKELSNIIKRALHVDPNKRFSNATALRHELDYFLTFNVQAPRTELLASFIRDSNKTGMVAGKPGGAGAGTGETVLLRPPKNRRPSAHAE